LQQKKRLLLVLICLAYIAFGLVTAVIGVIISRFQETYRVALWIAGLLPFAFYLAYGLGSIPFGLLMDRVGGRAVILLGMLLMTLGCFLFYASTHWLLTVGMVFLIGIGVTAIQTAGNPIIRDLDLPERYAGNLTIIIGISAFGYAISPIMVPVLEANGGNWQQVYLVFGVLNAILLLFLLIAKFPTTAVTENERIHPSEVLRLLRNRVVITYTIGIFFYVAGEVGVSSYIATFMERIHGVTPQQSLWAEGSFWRAAFPSVSALVVGLFWALQAVGRIIIGPLMRHVRPRAIFELCSGFCCLALIVAMFAPMLWALVFFALVGLFTCASFTLIFSGVIQSFDKNHGTLSGILCTAIVGGAVGGFLVGSVGDRFSLHLGMAVNLLAFLYVFSLAIWGKGKLDVEVR